MRKLFRMLRLTVVFINNVIVFLTVVIPRGIAVWKWPRAWRLIQQEHLREIRQELTELTMTGKIKRRIVDGEFVYFPQDQDG